MAVAALKPTQGSFIEQMATLLQENAGESEFIVDRALIEGFTAQMAEGYEIGQALSEHRRAVMSGNIHPRLTDTLGRFWSTIVMQPNRSSISAIGLTQLIRQAVATARAIQPPTVSLPQDSIFESAMLAMLLRIMDYTR